MVSFPEKNSTSIIVTKNDMCFNAIIKQNIFKHSKTGQPSLLTQMTDVIIIILMTQVRQSKSTHSLLSQLEQFKNNKDSLVTKLSSDIELNKQLLQSASGYKPSYKLKAINNRHQSIDALEQRLNLKKQNDHRNSLRLQSIQLKNSKKRQFFQQKLSQLANRNLQRIAQLKHIQEEVLSKITNDIKRNELKQKHLKQEYRRLQKEERIVSEADKHQKKASFQEWRFYQNQKWKLEALTRQNDKKQKDLINNKNPKVVRKEDKKKQDDKYLPNQKQYNRLKNNNVDSKAVGNKYLEQAKILHREVIENNKKKKMLNLNLKVINYDHQIQKRIFRNSSGLSKWNQKVKEEPENQEEKNSKQSEQEQKSNSQKLNIKSESGKNYYRVEEDTETLKYIKKVKGNIQQIQRLHQNPEATVSHHQPPPSVSDNLVVPATFQPASANQFI